MIDFVEFKLPVIGADGFPEIEDGEQVVQVKRGKLLHWGVSTWYDEERKVAMTNTVAIVQEEESGEVIKLDPEEITII